MLLILDRNHSSNIRSLLDFGDRREGNLAKIT